MKKFNVEMESESMFGEFESSMITVTIEAENAEQASLHAEYEYPDYIVLYVDED